MLLAACLFFVFCVSDRIRVGRPGFDSAASSFCFCCHINLSSELNLQSYRKK